MTIGAFLTINAWLYHQHQHLWVIEFYVLNCTLHRVFWQCKAQAIITHSKIMAIMIDKEITYRKSEIFRGIM